MARRLLVLSLFAAAALVATTAAGAAGEPRARTMVLASDDFKPGASVQYQGTKIAPVFAPVVAGMTITDRYSRTFLNANLGALPFIQVYSSGFVATSESQLATLTRNLEFATVPGPGRRAFVEGMQNAVGGLQLSLTRARKLDLGDEAVELVIHLKGRPGPEFDLIEIWIRQGHAVAAAAAASLKPLSAGQSFALAKLVNRHLKTARAAAS